jgi:hypothetical protein
MPPIFNNVSDVVPIMAVLPNIAVLGDASPCVVSSQAPVRAEGRCDFTSGTPCPIIMGPGRFSSGNAGRFFCYDQVRFFSPLLRQKSEGRAIGCHPLDGLHDSLHTYII